MRAPSLCLLLTVSSLGGCATVRLWRGGDSCATVEGCAQRLEDEAAVRRCEARRLDAGCGELVARMAAYGPAAEPFAARMLSSWDADVVDMGAAIFARLERPSPGSLDALIAAVEKRRRSGTGAALPEALVASARSSTPGAFAWLEQELEAGRCEVVKPLAGVGMPGREILLRSRSCCYFVGLALRPYVDAGVLAHYETELEGNGDRGCLLQTIAELGAPAAPLERVARDGAAWVAGVEAVHALARLDTESSRAVVADVARTHWFSFVRSEAERALAERGRGSLDRLLRCAGTRSGTRTCPSRRGCSGSGLRTTSGPQCSPSRSRVPPSRGVGRRSARRPDRRSDPRGVRVAPRRDDRGESVRPASGVSAPRGARRAASASGSEPGDESPWQGRIRR